VTRPFTIAAVGTGGLLIAWLLARAFGDTPLAALELVAIAAGTSLALSGLGVAIIAIVRQRSFVALLWIGITFTMVGVGAGIAIAGGVMFLSPMDTRAVIVMLVATGSVAIVTALVLGTRMATGIAEVARKAGGPPGNAPPVSTALPTSELGALADHLDDVFQQISDAQERERTLESSRRELIAWISHDLRTPLGGIRAMTEAIQDGVVSDAETIARYHGAIIGEVARLTSMVDDLFRLSQLHAGLVRLELEPVRLTDLVSDALSLATPVAEARGVMLTGEVAELDRLVGLSTVEFLRIMRNLLDNAIRHTPAGGSVLVAADTSGEEAVVAVRDGCGGIPGDELARVFELGFRGDIARSPVDGPRAGLGLAIAKGLVDAHGGTIAVENRHDGCCFTVRLPFASSTPAGHGVSA